MDERAVLIVDRDPELQFSLALVLKRSGYIVRAAFGSRDALGCLRDHPADLLILDLLLPDAYGLCLLSIVRRLYPSLPALVMAADDSFETILKALRLGACGYLLKPVDPQQVCFCAVEILKDQPRRFQPVRTRTQRIKRTSLGTPAAVSTPTPVSTLEALMDPEEQLE